MPNQAHDHGTVTLFINGKKSPSFKVIKLNLDEDGLFVFESLRSYGGIIFRLEEHLDRLFESAKTVGLEVPKNRAELKKELLSCADDLQGQDSFLRLAVDQDSSYMLVLERKRPDWIYKKGVDLKTAVTHRNFVNAAPPEPKTSAFFNNVLGFMEKGGREAYECIFLDISGYVTEATVWNIFMVKNDVVFTPQTGILRGVTRQLVIKCAEREGLAVSETNLTRHDFWNADEAFLTNTSGEIAPIRMLDGRTIGSKIPGDITKKLMVRFREQLDEELSDV